MEVGITGEELLLVGGYAVEINQERGEVEVGDCGVDGAGCEDEGLGLVADEVGCQSEGVRVGRLARFGVVGCRCGRRVGVVGR